MRNVVGLFAVLLAGTSLMAADTALLEAAESGDHAAAIRLLNLPHYLQRGLKVSHDGLRVGKAKRRQLFTSKPVFHEFAHRLACLTFAMCEKRFCCHFLAGVGSPEFVHNGNKNRQSQEASQRMQGEHALASRLSIPKIVSRSDLY